MLITLSEILGVFINAFVLVFILFYFFSLRVREKQIEKKENEVDNNYHHVVDEALSKERKILDDATAEADQIITGAEYLTKTSKQDVDQAVKNVVDEINHQGQNITRAFSSEYTNSLRQLTGDSLAQFQTVMKELQTDLHSQIKEFHETLLPAIEKELEEYKQEKLKSIDQTVTNIVQKAAQKILNKTLSISDHQALLTEALEKAKKEGVFD